MSCRNAGAYRTQEGDSRPYPLAPPLCIALRSRIGYGHKNFENYYMQMKPVKRTWSCSQ